MIKLAGRSGAIDLVEEFGFPAERAEALDVTTMLAIGAGLDALRDAGIPLVMRYKTATTGRMLPERWMLPEAYRDTTGVVFASAFPGYDSLVGELDRYHHDQALRQRLDDLQGLRARLGELGGGDLLAEELDHRIHALTAEIEDHPYQFDRKFLFHALSMGHSQFAEYIGARGPNTQVNSACASTTQAVALAEDWIRAGRCERVVIVSGDDVTSDRLLEWMGAGFLASGAAATDDVVADAAVPFDLRRHGMILGMGAAAIVVEAAASARRARHPAHRPGPRHRHREQRLPRHPTRHEPHQPGDGGPRGDGRAPMGHRPPRDRAADGLHLARDLHAGPGRQRPGRGRCAAARLRRLGRTGRDLQHQGLHRPRHGRRDRGRHRHQGDRDRDRAPGAELQGAGP